MRRILLSTAKILISGALLYLALRKVDLTELLSRFTASSLFWIGMAIAVTFLQIFVGVLRWRYVSAACGAPLELGRAMRYNVIGSFFNQTLPSAIGGDAVRLWLVARAGAGWRAATYSIFVDRAIGLVALAIVIVASLPWSYQLITDSHGRSALLLVDFAALAGGIGFLIFGALKWRWLKTWWATHHIHACALIANRVIFSRTRGPVIAVLSLLVHVLAVVIAWCVVQSIAAPVTFAQVFLLVPPVMLITLMPISIAGWGVREATMGLAFGFAGLAANEGVNISLLFGAVSFIVGAFGGLVWILSAEKAAQGSGASRGSGVTAPTIVVSLLAIAIAALISALITWTCRPLLQRYALARPNARSSHRIPTPQGAGIAVIAATLIVALALAAWANVTIPPALVIATIVIAMVGFADDIVSLPVLVRLVLQAACVGAVVFTTPDDARIVPALPLALERGLIVLAGIWFVNLVNFMDGLDLMTVAEVVPVTAALLLLGLLGELSWPAALIATALCGAMLGFAPFNKPVAKVFLGDVGSLPIGLLLGWCLLELAWHGQPAAALLLPAYYLADSTITLFRRVARREQFWSAHRSHFYQRATDNGFTVPRVIGETFALNLVLAVLAIISVRANSLSVTLIALVAGAIAVAFLLRRFSCPQAF